MNLGLFGAMFLPQRAIVPNPPVPDIPRLYVSGGDIVDYLGQPVYLRGYNQARWGTTIEDHIVENKSDGASCVRGGLRFYGDYGGVPGTDARLDSAVATAKINPDNLAILDALWDWTEARGIWMIQFLDSDCGQNGLQTGEPAYCDPDSVYPDGHNFWRDPVLRAMWIDVAVFIALRYADRTNFAMLELCTEPDPQGITQPDVTAFYDEMRTAVKNALAAAGKQPILYLIGSTRGYDYRDILNAYNPAWDDVVYTSNMLNGHSEAAAKCNALLTMRALHNVPVFEQQIGVQLSDDPDLVHINNCLTLLTDNNVGFTVWEYVGSNDGTSYPIKYRSAAPLNSPLLENTAKRNAIKPYFTKPPAVLPPPPSGVPAAITVPVLSDTTPQVGNVLSFSGDTYTNSPTAFTYRWQKGNSNISGATSSTYTVQTADIGKVLRVVVTPSNILGAGSPNISANSSAVTA